MRIRTAREEDVEGLLEIYNYEVEHGTATFDLNCKTIEERLVWLREHNKDNHPLIVAEEDGKITGYASLSPYRDKEAYKATVELSVYIHKDWRGKGLGERLMREIISMAKERNDIHSIISVITGGNEASIHLHEKLGFIHCGTIRETGVKFGKFLDIENYQLFVHPSHIIPI